MIEQIESSVVRIHAANGKIIGAGFLVGECRILTCTHTVAGALALPDGASEPPHASVHLDFPLVAPGCILTAKVVYWEPDGDIAELELYSTPPDGTRPVYLVLSDDLWGHAFRAFGFPAGHWNGVWASGVLRERNAAGWMQIEDVKETGYRVEPGFSGTPVWDEQLNGVVGMTVAADIDRTIKAAFIIPADLLVETWPELAQKSLEADSLEYLKMQLAMLKTAQQKASNPRRFQNRVEELRATIVSWDERLEQQQQRIAVGLDTQRQQALESLQDQLRVRSVGLCPLDVESYFRDREQELDTIGQLIGKPSTRLISVVGRGGMGKTAIVSKVLRDLQRCYCPYAKEDVMPSGTKSSSGKKFIIHGGRLMCVPKDVDVDASLDLRSCCHPSCVLPLDGIVYLSTRTSGIDLERIFFGCARLLGGEQEKKLIAAWVDSQMVLENKIASLLEALDDGCYVVLLDNLESLLDDQGELIDAGLRLFFERCLATTHNLRLVVTSRLSLALTSDQLRFDRKVRLTEGLSSGDGIALLRELDPNGDYGLRDAPEEKLAQAVSLVHGVPRALEVLVGILANDPFSTLDQALSEFYTKEDAVHDLIEENYRRLDANGRRVIDALAVFKYPVPPLAVDYLLEPFLPGINVPNIVRRLAQTGIVTMNRMTKTVILHPIDQSYAYSQLPDAAYSDKSAYTRKLLERRAADYYAQIRTSPETWRTIDELAPQLWEFEHRVNAEDYDEACRVLNLVSREYLYLWGFYARLAELREELVEHLVDPSLQITNWGSLGRAYHGLGRFNDAIKAYEKALGVSQSVNDRWNEGVWLSHLARVYRALGRIEKGIELSEEALSIDQAIGAHKGESIQLGQLGSAYRALGQIRQAISFYQQALIIDRKNQERRWEGIHLNVMARAYYALGEIEKAITLSEKALDIAIEIGDNLREGFVLSDLGLFYGDLGRLEQAIEFQSRALIIFCKLGSRREQSFALLRLGKINLDISKDLSKARSYFEEVLPLNFPETSYLAALYLGIVLLHENDAKAKEVFDDSVSRCRAVLNKTSGLYEPRYVLATALVGRAVCNLSRSNNDEVVRLLTPALTEYKRAIEICNARGVISNVLRDLKLIQEAGIEKLGLVTEVLEKAKEVGDRGPNGRSDS